MFSKIIQNLQTFLVTWVIIIVINQLFIFGACFAPYCIMAALPHTGIIAAVILYFIIDEETTSDNIEPFKNTSTHEYTKKNEYVTEKKEIQVIDKINEDEIADIEELKEPYCPKCGSKMVLRTARNGRYAGSKFWGCSKFPKCKSIINI